MNSKQLMKLRNIIFDKYKWGFFLEFSDKPGDFGSYITGRVIIVPQAEWDSPTEWTIFAFLHEIGHLKTNTTTMKRFEQEYLATQWAIDESKRIGFSVPSSYINIYQNYIWRWRERAIKRKCKNVMSKEEITLKLQ